MLARHASISAPTYKVVRGHYSNWQSVGRRWKSGVSPLEIANEPPLLEGGNPIDTETKSIWKRILICIFCMSHFRIPNVESGKSSCAFDFFGSNELEPWPLREI